MTPRLSGRRLLDLHSPPRFVLEIPRVPRRGSLPTGIKESHGDNRLDVLGAVHIVHDRRPVSSRGFAGHIRSGRSGGPFVQSADDRFRIAVDYRQQDTGRTVRDASSLFPILDSPGIEPEPIREFLAAQLHAFAQSHYVLRGGIVKRYGLEVPLRLAHGRALRQELPPAHAQGRFESSSVRFLLLDRSHGAGDNGHGARIGNDDGLHGSPVLF